KREGRLKNVQTLLNVNASYTDRRKYYTIRSIDGSWGYQWSRARQVATSDNQAVSSTRAFLWKPINIEYNTLDAQDILNAIFVTNPSLKQAFRTGLIIGQQFIYNSVRQKGNKIN